MACPAGRLADRQPFRHSRTTPVYFPVFPGKMEVWVKWVFC